MEQPQLKLFSLEDIKRAFLTEFPEELKEERVKQLQEKKGHYS